MGPFWNVLLAAGGFFVVPWGLVIAALCAPDHDVSFVVISLIYALVLTPLGIVVLWSGESSTGSGWGDNDWNPGSGT